jgi:hypothetical protein
LTVIAVVGDDVLLDKIIRGRIFAAADPGYTLSALMELVAAVVVALLDEPVSTTVDLHTIGVAPDAAA